MEKKYYWLVGLLAIAILLFINIRGSETEIKPFNASPVDCSEIANCLYKIPEAKIRTIYKTKITIYRDFSPGEYLKKHPCDVAIQTSMGDGDSFVIILTNDYPYDINV